MKITIEIDSNSELEKLSALLKEFKINSVNVVSPPVSIPLIKGDKTINPKDLFGIWADNPRNIETIREAAWKRSRSI